MHYKNLTLAFVFTGILLISIFAVYAYQQQKINSLLNSQQLSQSKTGLLTVPTPVPTSVSDSTSGWQTYNEPTTGYTFQYPSNWTVKIDSPIQKNGGVYQGAFSLTGLEGEIHVYLGGGFGGGLCSSFGGQIVDTMIGNYHQKNCYTRTSGIDKVDNYSATCGDCGGITINQTPVSIAYSIKNQNTQNLQSQVVKKILASFKFTQ